MTIKNQIINLFYKTKIIKTTYCFEGRKKYLGNIIAFKEMATVEIGMNFQNKLFSFERFNYIKSFFHVHLEQY